MDIDPNEDGLGGQFVAPAPATAEQNGEKLQSSPSLEQRVRDAIKAAIPEWMMGHIHSSPVARHTDAYNHLTQSMASLEEAIVRKL